SDECSSERSSRRPPRCCQIRSGREPGAPSRSCSPRSNPTSRWSGWSRAPPLGTVAIMRRRDGLRAALLALALLPALSFGYEPQVHQRLTFHAAKILNRCLEGSRIPPLTPLQVRFIATSNMGLANSNFLVRFFRWSYFDMADRDDRQLLWLISTRFLEHF